MDDKVGGGPRARWGKEEGRRKTEKKKKRGCGLAPERRGIKMAFPKGCANLDKLYSGFFSSSSPPSPTLLLLPCFSSSPTEK